MNIRESVDGDTKASLVITMGESSETVLSVCGCPLTKASERG